MDPPAPRTKHSGPTHRRQGLKMCLQFKRGLFSNIQDPSAPSTKTSSENDSKCKYKSIGLQPTFIHCICRNSINECTDNRTNEIPLESKQWLSNQIKYKINTIASACRCISFGLDCVCKSLPLDPISLQSILIQSKRPYLTYSRLIDSCIFVSLRPLPRPEL